MKSYNHSNPNYKREKTLKLRPSLYLRLGSLRSGRKWFLFFVDPVNVRAFWESSLQIMDGVTQLLSKQNLKETWVKTWTQQVDRRVELFSIPQLKILIKLLKFDLPLSFNSKLNYL